MESKKKVELFTDLGLKEICGLIAILGTNTDIESIQDTITIDGKKYYVEKNGNTITIVGPNNSSCRVSINYSEDEQEENNRKVIYINHNVDIDVKHGDNTINMKNNLVLDLGYKAFENTYRHDLMRGLKLDFNKEADFNLGLSRIHLNENNKDYGFTSIGITEGNKELLIDGDSIKVDPSIKIDDLEGMKKALLTRNSIISTVKESSITPEVLEEVERHFRRVIREIKSQKEEPNQK